MRNNSQEVDPALESGGRRLLLHPGAQGSIAGEDQANIRQPVRQRYETADQKIVILDLFETAHVPDQHPVAMQSEFPPEEELVLGERRESIRLHCVMNYLR